MFINADQKLKDLKHLNQYDDAGLSIESEIDNATALCQDCLVRNECQFPVYADNNSVMCEKNLQ